MAQSNSLTPQSVVGNNNQFNNQHSIVNPTIKQHSTSNQSPSKDKQQYLGANASQNMRNEAHLSTLNASLQPQKQASNSQTASYPSATQGSGAGGRSAGAGAGGIRHSNTVNGGPAQSTTGSQSQPPLQSLPDMAHVSLAQQRHQMDQEFAAAATGSATPVAIVNPSTHQQTSANINSSIGKLLAPTQTNNIQQQQHQKRSALLVEEQPISNTSKFRLQSLISSSGSGVYPNSAAAASAGPNAAGASSQQQQATPQIVSTNATQALNGGVFSTQMAEQKQVQYSRSFKGTGNQIAAMVGQPFMMTSNQQPQNNTTALVGQQQQSTLSQLTQQQMSSAGSTTQQIVNFREIMAARTTNTALDSNTASAALSATAVQYLSSSLHHTNNNAHTAALCSTNESEEQLPHHHNLGGSSSHLAHHHNHHHHHHPHNHPTTTTSNPPPHLHHTTKQAPLLPMGAPASSTVRATVQQKQQQQQQQHQQQQTTTTSNTVASGGGTSKEGVNVSSAGRKTRIKSSGRKRRFSTNSINNGGSGNNNNNSNNVNRRSGGADSHEHRETAPDQIIDSTAVAGEGGYDIDNNGGCQLDSNRGKNSYLNNKYGPLQMGQQAAAQIIQNQHQQFYQQQRTTGGLGSGNTTTHQQMISSVPTAYSSVGELKIQNQGTQGVRSGATAYYQTNAHSGANSSEVTGVMDRFNSRAQKKALNSVQTVSASNKEKLYNNLQQIVDAGQQHPAQRKQNHHHQQYGTHQSYNSTTSATNVHKQGSHSVTRRNHHVLQETASGHCLDSGSQNSQRSNNGMDRQQEQTFKDAAVANSKSNYNSLRNSKSLNKKLSQTGSKKQKKLKKSESQARHQQITKSEMMTQQMRDQEHDIELNSQERQKNSFPSGLNSMNGTSSAMNRPAQNYPQQEPHVKRISNRTPQSFTVNNDKVIGGLQSAGNKAGGATTTNQNKYTDVVKGSTTANAAGNAQVGSNQANAVGGSFGGKNITDLHKNAMHIKKLNFGGASSGGRQMQSHATQPLIPPQSQQTQQTNTTTTPAAQQNSHYTAGAPQHTLPQPPVMADRQPAHMMATHPTNTSSKEQQQQQSNQSYQSTLQQQQQQQQHPQQKHHHHAHHHQQLSSSGSKQASAAGHHYTDRAQYFSAPNQAATSTIESLLRNAAATGQNNNSFQDFKNGFGGSGANSGQKHNHHQPQHIFGQVTTSAASNQVTQKTYKMMKSAERGANTTSPADANNMLIQQQSSMIGACRLHQENPSAIASSSTSPCTCSGSKPQRQQNSGGGFQSKASQNFQKSFRHGNFVYHGGAHRRSNDFSTIQAKQTSSSNNNSAAATQNSPFSTNIAQTPSFNQQQPQSQQTPHITQQKREDVNKFGGNFSSSQNNQQQLVGGGAAQQNHQTTSASNNSSATNSNLNPLMKDLLQYLQQAYQSQNQTEQSMSQQQHQHQQQQQSQTMGSHSSHQQPPNAVDQLKQRLAQAQMRQAAQQQQQQQNQAGHHNSEQPAPSFSQQLASSAQKNKLIHFEKGDRIIYEPNEMHQLKYINDKGEVSPITGVQYILTQPNFSKGRPCHFFVVNKQEFEAATKGFKLKQEEQKAEELAKQRKMQAVANIRSHRASQKIRTHNTATGAGGKGKKGAMERKQSAKGGRDANGSGKDGGAKTKEEEKKDDKDKYHNQAYNYQKLKSLKWMGGPYRNPHDDPAPIWRPSAEEQELRQQLEAKREIKAKYNLLSLNKQAGIELYKYILMLGNNQEVVKRVMDSRPSWTQIKSTQTLYNFKWAPSSRQIKFDFLGKHGQKNLVNHFENHALITTKDQLIESMSKLCENLHQDVFNSIPITFVIDLGTPLCQHEFDKFTYYYNMVEKFRDQYLDAEDETGKQEVLGQMNKSIQQHYQLSEKKRKSTTVTMRSTLYNGHNMWLFKPADANRGRGVNLFNTIDQLKRLILEHTSRAETKQFQNFAHANNLHGAAGANSTVDNQDGAQAASSSNNAYASQAASHTNNNQTEQTQPANTSSVKSDVFVLQKYIERPLLINQRKFDIRLWVMITPEHKCYYFKEGYIRMSGQKYDLNKADNLFVHLTNNAIQKHGQNYGEFEEGNILSFKEGADYLRKQDNLEVDFYQLLKDEMLPIIETTMMSVRQKINKNNRKFCMEIFGYDFMIDNMLRPWLIEVNTNPCLEESNQLLRHLIPRMLDDAFKLTLDVMFPPKTAAQIAEATAIMQDDSAESPAATNQAANNITAGKPEVFSVPGRPDGENLWGDQPFYILRVPGAVVVQGS